MRSGIDIAGVSVATLAIGCLVAAVAFVALRGRPSWLLGLVFMAALVPAAEAANYVTLIEKTDGAKTSEGLYLILAGLGLAIAGSMFAFVYDNLSRRPTEIAAAVPVSLPEDETAAAFEPGEPGEP